MQKFICKINTNGQGYWSRAARSVDVLAWDIAYVDEEETFGELRVYFDPYTWNVDELGLIYTDSQFMQELQGNLILSGFSSSAAADVGYSEMGMQGDIYVSCDVGAEFINAVKALYPEKWAVTAERWV